MPITFAADFDYKSMRHVSLRSRKEREAELPPMPTAEDAARWENREIRTPRPVSDWRPSYDDGVEARRNAEKAARDEAARQRLAEKAATAKPAFALEKLVETKVRADRLVSSEQRIIAEIIGTTPQALSWSGNLYTMTAAEILAIANRCREASDPVFAWNLNVKLHEPRVPSPIIAGPRVIYDDPNRRSGHRMATLGFNPKKSQNDLVTEWMRMAEDDRLPGRSTRCAVTGRSLVIKTNYFGKRSWSLAPTFHGMSVEAAQQIASAAAIQAGLVRGTIRGTPPPLVESLRNNAQDWLGLVIATRHPVFYTVASQLVKMGADRLQFTADPNANRSAWEKLSSTIGMSDASSVPDHRD
jgi:hypothetical protein